MKFEILSLILILGTLGGERVLRSFIIKFRYNARSDWLKQRALSEYRCTE